MRDNPVKEKLAAGSAALGAMVFEFFTPGIARICANAGAEFVMYCMEHTGASFETLKPQFSLCRALGIVPLARVPATEYHFIARALDTGALGIMVPMVDTREQAELIVSCTRYPPAGRRGAAFGFAHDDYEGGDVAEKIRMIHRRTLVICMIETKTKNGKAAGYMAADEALGREYLGHGFRMIATGTDQGMLQNAIRRSIDAWRGA